MSSFFKIGGGGGGVKPEMTNVIFFLFFLMKASLMYIEHNKYLETVKILQNGFLIESGIEELINNNGVVVLRCFGR